MVSPVTTLTQPDLPDIVASLIRDENEFFAGPVPERSLDALDCHRHAASIFSYDMTARTRTLLKQTEVLGGYDASKYKGERVWVTASDGAKIPVSLVYRADLRGSSPQPLYLYGYGSYGSSLPDNFASGRLSLLDRGVIYAIAHIRGGGELGEPWREAGRMKNKMTTFTVFIACAEFLAHAGYTKPAQIVTSGASAGGLLMGAVLNLRPDLFHAAVVKVPFVDVLNTMLDASFLVIATLRRFHTSI